MALADGLANAGLQFITGGRSWGLFDRTSTEPGHARMRKLADYGVQARCQGNDPLPGA